MQIIIKTAHHTWRWTLRFCLFLLLTIALLLAVLRLSLPLVADYRAEIEQRIGAHLNVPVHIEQLQITWWGWGPALAIDGFSLLDPADGQVRLGFRRALAGLNVARSLMSGRLIWQQISLQGGDLALQWSQKHGLRLLPGRQVAATVPAQELLSWLFRTRTLDLRFEQLSIQRDDADTIHGGEFLLSLRGTPQQRRVDATLALPASWGDKLQMAAELNGHANVPDQWQIDFYLHGSGLNLAALPDGQARLAGGRADVELWAGWERNQLSEIIGRTRFDQLRLSDPAVVAGHTPENISLDWYWHPSTVGWQMRGRLYDSDATVAQAIDSTIDISRHSVAGQSWLAGEIDRLPLGRLSTLAAAILPPARREMLQKLAPEAQLNDIRFRIPQAPSVTPWQISARFDDLQTRPWRRIPAISGVAGELSLTRDNGWLSLSGTTPTLHWKLLPEPVAFERLQGMFEWQKQADGWWLTTTGFDIASADLTGRLRGSVTLPAGAKPVLDLRIDYHDIDIAKAYRYLPKEILKPKLHEWLQQALIGGRIPFGGTVMTGDLADFPFAGGNGLIETRLWVEDAIFSPKPGWPRFDRLSAEVIFSNDRFEFNTANARLFDMDLHDVHGQIDHLGKTPLRVSGRVQGPGASMLRYVRESPLQDKLGQTLQGFELDKASQLALNLLLPLKKEEAKNLQVEGVLSFDGNQLTIPQHNIDLADIQGQLTFTKETISADALALRFRGEPAQLAITTRQPADGAALYEFHLQGELGLNALLDKQAALFESHFNGRSQWDVVLRIPKLKPTQGRQMDIDFQSDLQGMKVLLPPPLAKAADIKRTLKGHLDIEPAAMDLTLQYGLDTRAVIRLNKDNGALQIERGALSIGAEPPQLPAAAGLHIFARLKQFELAAFGAGQGLPPWLRTLQAQIAELKLGPWRLYDTRVDLANMQDRLTVDLNGADISGRMTLPALPDRDSPIQAQLKRVRLTLPESPPENSQIPSAAPIDPRRIPPLQLLADEVSLDGHALGQLAVLVTPDADGLKLEQLELQSEKHRLSASGEWHVLADNRQQSRIQAHLYAAALGKTLQTLGYDSVSIAGAETFADLDVAWPGPFNGFSMDNLRGAVDVQIEKGQFLKLDPGLGRVVGLFNVATLTRRLRLDFSDLFASGLAFDGIAGHIEFSDGRARTDDLLLRGPSANILLSGSIGLSQRDFHQIVTVMPQLGTSLALAGALTGGPAVGAAVLLAGQLFKSKLDQVIAYQYSLTGSWDDPQVEILRQSEDDNDETGFGQR